MADYDQPDYIEKRVRYFDGQFLKDQDFVDEQKYFIDRQRRYNRFLNVSGIVDGLAVKVKPGTTDLVTVDPGTALDAKGRQIVLSDQGPETDRQVPLQSSRGATADLVMTYNEEGSDQAQAGSAGFTRFYEKPRLITVPSGQTAPDGAITLARLTINATGGVEVNNTVRVYVGVRLPYDGAAPGTGPALRAGSTNRLDLTGDLSVSGNTNVGGTLSVTGTSTLTGNASVGGTLSVTGTSTLTGNASVGATLSVTGISTFTGNVGIGTTPTSAAPLEVRGEDYHIAITNKANHNWGIVNWSDDRLYFQYREAGVFKNNVLSLDKDGTLRTSGKISTPMWGYRKIFDRQPGPLPIQSSFVSNGGLLIVFTSGTTFKTTGGEMSLQITIDKDNPAKEQIRYVDLFTNEGNSHKVFPTVVDFFPAVASGTHTLTISNYFPDTLSDVNDRFCVSLLELPI